MKILKSGTSLISAADIREALETTFSAPTDVLYVHSGLTWGTPLVSRKTVLQEILSVLQSLGFTNIVFPTFTFSFVNGETFDSKVTHSRMGALSEYARQTADAVRTPDPLMSVAWLGPDHRILQSVDDFSIGENGVYSLLERHFEVQFLFFGVEPGACFTYMHHLEWVAQVDYRFQKPFCGPMLNGCGPVGGAAKAQHLFVRRPGVFANAESFAYVDELRSARKIATAHVGGTTFESVGLRDARNAYLAAIEANPVRFVDFCDPAEGNRDFEVSLPMVAL